MPPSSGLSSWYIHSSVRLAFRTLPGENSTDRCSRPGSLSTSTHCRSTTCSMSSTQCPATRHETPEYCLQSRSSTAACVNVAPTTFSRFMLLVPRTPTRHSPDEIPIVTDKFDRSAVFAAIATAAMTDLPGCPGLGLAALNVQTAWSPWKLSMMPLYVATHAPTTSKNSCCSLGMPAGEDAKDAWNFRVLTTSTVTFCRATPRSSGEASTAGAAAEAEVLPEGRWLVLDTADERRSVSVPVSVSTSAPSAARPSPCSYTASSDCGRYSLRRCSCRPIRRYASWIARMVPSFSISLSLSPSTE
eukprot:gene600-biopygen613